jgi:type II secretory pathway pseudopilin PulG
MRKRNLNKIIIKKKNGFTLYGLLITMSVLGLLASAIHPKISSLNSQNSITFNNNKELQIIKLYIKYHKDNDGDTGLFPQNIDDLITQGKSDNLLISTFDKKNFLGNDYDFSINGTLIDLNSSVPTEYVYERTYYKTYYKKNPSYESYEGTGFAIDKIGRKFNILSEI